MVTTQWQQQNFQTRNTGVTITVSVSILLTGLLLLVGMAWMSQWLGIVVVVAGLVATHRRMRKNAETMTRVLRQDYEEIERDFRMIFKDHNIRYYRRMDEDAYAYEFPGRSLTMRVEPYVFHNLLLSRTGNPNPAACIHLRKVNSQNAQFAEFLAETIDARMAMHATAW